MAFSKDENHPEHLVPPPHAQQFYIFRSITRTKKMDIEKELESGQKLWQKIALRAIRNDGLAFNRETFLFTQWEKKRRRLPLWKDFHQPIFLLSFDSILRPFSPWISDRAA